MLSVLMYSISDASISLPIKDLFSGELANSSAVCIFTFEMLINWWLLESLQSVLNSWYNIAYKGKGRFTLPSKMGNSQVINNIIISLVDILTSRLGILPVWANRLVSRLPDTSPSVSLVIKLLKLLLFTSGFAFTVQIELYVALYSTGRRPFQTGLSWPTTIWDYLRLAAIWNFYNVTVE